MSELTAGAAGRGDRRDRRRGEVDGAAGARAAPAGARQGGGPVPGPLRGRARAARRRLRAGARRSPPSTPTRSWRPRLRRPGGRERARRRGARGRRADRSTRSASGACRDQGGRRVAAGDGRRPGARPGDRQARADDRRDPVPRRTRSCGAGHGDDRKPVVVDAAGYRARRDATLEALAVRSAERAISSGQAIELDPMTAVERKIVHLRLKEFPGVTTRSEGTEPNRFVVIEPGLTDGASSAGSKPLVATPGLTSIRDRTRRGACCRRQPARARARAGAFDGPIVDVGSGGGAPGIPLAAALAGARGDAARVEPAQVRLPRGLGRGVPERAGRLRPGRGAAGRRLGRGACEGARAAARRRRVVPAAGRSGRRGDPVRRPQRRCRPPSRRPPAASAAELSDSPPGLLVLRKLGPTPAGFPRRPGVARKRPLA